jgi:hypothetical protein
MAKGPTRQPVSAQSDPRLALSIPRSACAPAAGRPSRSAVRCNWDVHGLPHVRRSKTPAAAGLRFPPISIQIWLRLGRDPVRPPCCGLASTGGARGHTRHREIGPRRYRPGAKRHGPITTPGSIRPISEIRAIMCSCGAIVGLSARPVRPLRRKRPWQLLPNTSSER